MTLHRSPSSAHPPDTLSPLDHDASTRDRIIEAAVAVFERKGYAAASVREIVERAGVTKPALYYHFGSKQGLIIAILDAAARDLRAVIDEALRLPGSARERVQRVSAAIFQLIQSRRSELRVSHTVYFNAAELLPGFDFEVFDRAIVGTIESCLQAGIDTGELKSVTPAEAALTIVGVLMLCFDQEILRREGRLNEASLRRMIDLVFDGLQRSAPR